MALTAKKLGKDGARWIVLDGIIQDHLQLIDIKLLRAGRTWGQNMIVHELPTMLNFHGLDKKDAQILVYGGVIRSLETRGFHTELILEPSPERTYIRVTWRASAEHSHLQKMSALVRSKSTVVASEQSS